MTKLEALWNRLREDWRTPRASKAGALSLVCRFDDGIPEEHLPTILKRPVPADLRHFWSLANESFLFLDHEYGQWGLHLLSPFDAENETSLFGQERARDAMPGDLIIGTFLGDSDLLLIRCDPNAGDFGHLIVATPLDRREDWHVVSSSLADFLKQYEMSEGGKFWEPQISLR